VQRGFRPTEEVAAKIQDLYAQGQFVSQIAEEIGVEPHVLRDHIYREARPTPEPGVKTPRGFHVSPAGYDRVHALARLGHTQADIERTIGLPRKTVTSALRKGPEGYYKGKV
jgi:hypothetical protein